MKRVLVELCNIHRQISINEQFLKAHRTAFVRKTMSAADRESYRHIRDETRKMQKEVNENGCACAYMTQLELDLYGGIEG